jgi:hypothetical protein
MDHPFEQRLKAAVSTGWWVVLLAYVLLLVQWLAYLQFMKAKPEWFLALWGPDVGWPEAQKIWMLVMSFWKMGCWFWALVMLWLTLWSRRLSS